MVYSMDKDSVGRREGLVRRPNPFNSLKPGHIQIASYHCQLCTIVIVLYLTLALALALVHSNSTIDNDVI